MMIHLAEIQNLLDLSEKLENQGNIDEAATLAATANRLIATAEKEDKEEKAARSMSGKAKAKFRAVKKAAEALCAADLDYRGENKSACRKVEMLCEDILEALKDCSFE